MFVEIEGGDRGIAAAAQALGRSPADYVLESYRGLFVRHCEERGVRRHRHAVRGRLADRTRAGAGRGSRHAAAAARRRSRRETGDADRRRAAASGASSAGSRQRTSPTWSSICTTFRRPSPQSSATAAISTCACRYSWEQPQILGSAGGPRQRSADHRRLVVLHRQRRHADGSRTCSNCNGTRVVGRPRDHRVDSKPRA